LQHVKIQPTRIRFSVVFRPAEFVRIEPDTMTHAALIDSYHFKLSFNQRTFTLGAIHSSSHISANTWRPTAIIQFRRPDDSIRGDVGPSIGRTKVLGDSAFRRSVETWMGLGVQIASFAC
jgi:hypothetical protein